MNTAKQIDLQDPEGLYGLVTLLGRIVQARALSAWINRSDGIGFQCLPEDVMFSTYTSITKGGKTFGEVVREVSRPGSIALATDVILPWPWEPERVVNSLTCLRPGGRWGEWKQDGNHLVELWLPMRIGWVHGGNHSIAAGIVYGTGCMQPEVCYDISPVYRHVRCDGLSYFRLYDRTTIAPVADVELAAIFEIGRLMTAKRPNV